MQIEPSVTDWITAISTSGAVIAATFAGLAAWKAFGLEKTASDQRDEDRRADQASRVAAWIAEVRNQPPQDGSRQSAFLSAFPYTACVVLNTSPLPVSDVLLRYVMLGEDRKPRTVGSSPEVVIPPGEDTRRVHQNALDEWEAHKDEFPTLAVEIRFTDTSGRRWWRTWNGELIDKGMYKPGVGDEASAE